MQVNSAVQSAAAAAANTSTGTKTTKSATGMDALAQESTFLKLLVAQMKYQDPTAPTDSMQYLQQLSQYAQLEQMTQMNSELKSFHDDIETALTPATKTGSN